MVGRRTNLRPRRLEQTILEQPWTEIAKEFLDNDPSHLYKKLVASVGGYGVFTQSVITKGSFVINYLGVHTNQLAGIDDDTYVYIYTYKGEKLCIDARKENCGLGRFINDIDWLTKSNCKAEIVELETGGSTISFVATRDIEEGKQIQNLFLIQCI